MASERDDVSRFFSRVTRTRALQPCQMSSPDPTPGLLLFSPEATRLWEPEPHLVDWCSRFCQNCVPLRTQGERDHARSGKPGHEQDGAANTLWGSVWRGSAGCEVAEDTQHTLRQRPCCLFFVHTVGARKGPTVHPGRARSRGQWRTRDKEPCPYRCPPRAREHVNK